MSRIFKAELYKITHIPSFVFSVLFAFPVGMLLCVVAGMGGDLSVVDVFEENLSMLGYYFMAITVIYVTNDYEKNTIKAIISSGVSKSKIYISRLCVCVLVAEIALLLAVAGEFIYAAVTGMPITNEAHPWTAPQFMASIGLQMLFTMLLVGLGYFVAILIRKQMPAIMVSGVFLGAEALVIGGIGKTFKIDLSALNIPTVIEQMDSLNITSNVLIGTAVLVVLVLIVTFGIGVQVFKRRDI